MNQAPNVESSSEVGNAKASPDYNFYALLREAPKSLSSALEPFKRRAITELAVITAQISLTILARDIILTQGAGMPPPQAFFCVMALALLLWAPAVYLFFMVGKQRHAEITRRPEGTPEPRDERGNSR